MQIESLSHSKLLDLLEYDQHTGVFVWRKRSGNRVAGSVAGWQMNKGYIHMKVDGKVFLAHRLAWFYVHKQWPIDQIDHIDRNKTNNALRNLRQCSQSQNMHNRAKQSNNKTGFHGVHKKGKKFIAQIGDHKRKYFLGAFDDPKAAHEAYMKAKQLMQPKIAGESNE